MRGLLRVEDAGWSADCCEKLQSIIMRRESRFLLPMEAILQ